MTPFEGLGYSEGPCAEVLSVAGFFDVPGPFPLGRKVYSEGERNALLSGKPTRVDGTGITDINAHGSGARDGATVLYTGMYTAGLPTWVY